MRAIVADVGGANARFAIASRQGEGPICLEHFVTAPTRGADFEQRLETFLSDVPDRPALCAVSAAGPVKDGRVELLNSGWVIEAHPLRTRFGFEAFHLFNDFAAMARAAPELGEADLDVLWAGEPRPGPMVIGGPGTGFGLAVLAPSGEEWTVVSGEGGHRAYGPQTAFEWEVVQVLRRAYDYVSVEVVAGGKHLGAVYKAVCQVMDQPPAEIDPHSIVALAEAGDAICQAVCQLRADITLTTLGDAALMAGGAPGGVFVAGGESIRLKRYMAGDSALARFHRRGPRSEYLAETPIRLITRHDAGLIGAAAWVL